MEAAEIAVKIEEIEDMISKKEMMAYRQHWRYMLHSKIHREQRLLFFFGQRANAGVSITGFACSAEELLLMEGFLEVFSAYERGRGAAGNVAVKGRFNVSTRGRGASNKVSNGRGMEGGGAATVETRASQTSSVIHQSTRSRGEQLVVQVGL